MEPQAEQSTKLPRPMIRQPVDSYHRHIRAVHGVENSSEPGSSSGLGRSDSHRLGSAFSGSQHGNVASFFDSERLASSAAPFDPSNNPSPTRSSGIRWPFLGSIKSRMSQAFPDSPRLSPSEPTQIELPWRPVFLHRRILAIYALVFVVLIAGVQVALQLSEHNGGLHESDDLSRYLWQYGTTIIFILVAAFWYRVEFQASASMPWIRMLNTQVEADKSLLLDYVSLSEPVAIFKSIKNKDWLVTIPVIAGIIFKIMVIFSVAFITPKVTTVANHKIATTIQSEFSNNISGLENVGSLPYFTLAALAVDNITFPNGVTSRAAYTPFISDIPELKQITARVDGFIGGMDCEEAELTLDSMRLRNGNAMLLNMTLSNGQCSSNQTITSTKLVTTNNEDPSRMFLAFQPGRCGNSAKGDDQRIAVMAGVLDVDIDQLKRQSRTSNNRLDGKISSSAAFLCKPNYIITRIKVTKTPEAVLSVIPDQQATNTTLSQVPAWTVARAMFDTFESDQATELKLLATFTNSSYSREAILDTDEAMSAALALSSRNGGDLPSLESLTENDTLRRLSENFFTQYSALVARYAMMKPSSSTSTAIASYIERRIVVRPVPAYIITAFLAICFVLVVSTMFLVPRKGFLPRDPSTIVGMASVVAHSHPLVECLKGMGAAPNKALRARLDGSTYLSGAEGHEKLENPNLGYYHIFGGNAPPANVLPRRFDSSGWRQPVTLHGLIRLIYILVLACIIIGFEISLRVSQRNDGLRTMKDDGAYIAWTVVPALVLLLVAMYMLSLEWWTRLLSPFSHLSRRGEFEETVGLNLVNALRHAAWSRALKIRDIAALAAISGGFVALLMVVATAPLFEPMPVGQNTSIALRTEDFFANSLASSSDDPICTDCTNDTIMASLILAGDAPYPPFTYANLNVPNMSLAEAVEGNDLTFSARLTAIRPNMSCRLYQSDEISTNLTLEYKLDDRIVNPLRVDLEGETCRGSGERNGSNAIIGTTTTSFPAQHGRSLSRDTLFGVGLRKTRSSPHCSDWLYIWGELVDVGSSDMSVSSINALACNESIEAVDVVALFHGPNDLRLYPDHQPIPVESTAQDTTVAIPELDYSKLINVTSDGLLDTFFAMLNASQFAVPDSTFGSSTPSAANEVQSAILSQHGIIRAQSLNFRSRRHLSSRGTFPVADGTNIVSGIDPDEPVSQAVPVISGSQVTESVRLRQDAIATRILQGIVGALMLLHIISWIYWRRIRLPRSPTTIASVTALLVDGNLFKSLPRAAQWQPDSELEAIFTEGDTPQRFQLGFDRKGRGRGCDGRAKKEEGNFGIRAIVPKEHIPEEVEMRPLPPPKPPPKPVKERIGVVRQGTGLLGEDGTQRKSVLVTKGHTNNSKSKSSKGSKDSKGSSGSNGPNRKRSISSALSVPKEMVKVWWAGGS
ncbi:hypothetical protein BFJ63_vAg6433 [Fusarium oxysporum f. sp. narcissi]|uniref:Uncharacterized protein n=1 Tax=Fusarium oxysporum f. sp. narcissi TaxID=451672 RepID=A0A4Q2VVB0_FUSOX|nr:hypothetical protein BFJ63_vAg6433 [Fusarium oxysporum f. sp. narcissi]